MNNLAYSNQQADKVGQQVEEKLRKELGTTAAVPFQIELASEGGPTAGTVLSDIAHGLFSGHPNLLFTLVFNIPAPRTAQLRASVERQGIGCHVGSLLYSTSLAKTINGEVILGAPKLFGGAKFEGDAEVCGKLNAKGDLLKRLGKFARSEAEIGGLTIKQERLVKLVPQAGGLLLVIGTLPRATSMGMDAALDAREFYDLAALIESAL
jgi:hypothetical protein